MDKDLFDILNWNKNQEVWKTKDNISLSEILGFLMSI
jgi:hypothetical protein